MECQVSPWPVRNAELREAWSTIESRNSFPVSPFLTWDFFESVAQVRSDVQVAVFREAGAIVGCFPYQQARGERRAIPVAGLLNDLHGPLAGDLGSEEFSQILRVARLSRFDFHASPKMPWNLAGDMSYEMPACRAQLGVKPGEYVAHLLDSRYSVRQQKRKTRAIERKLGCLRMEWETRDDAILDTLLSWKSQQYKRTGVFDIFSLPWTRHLLRHLLHQQSEAMHGQMSALFAGNELIAIHFGLRSRTTLHCWFPAYSVQHARLSPCIELFLRMATRGPGEGVTALDLGIGDETYKQKLSNETYSVVRGSLDLIRWRSKLRSLTLAAHQQAKRLPWYDPLKTVVRQALSVRARRRYQ